MASTDVQSLQVDAPRRTLSKFRRRKDNDASSSKSSLAEGQDDTSTGLRASIDGAIGKLKDRTGRRRSSDDRRGSVDSQKDPSNRLSMMSLSKKRRNKNRRADESTSSTQDDDRRLSNVGISPSPSQLSLGLEGSGHSSLLTEDSDDDG